ncbi:hypothetical protein M409DRAFT_27927 [Zasmidium cellare ATCC 36951]|uniref:Uncharacterized protein n=1 Tax=Zasmidium cellare ATCC 36951 TaxID=1080233 RepID=A0A6A6C706_ZASCE|nr:uncharacterized protein M409DRAFT_27927 [Zasmidium cellare ATCC 36951]KAF2161529.1 hypothetical protein M409DRAFT_27927 [Zasmidium cellare ATCC 36951]
MRPFQRFAQNTYLNVNAWLNQRQRAQPKQPAINPRLPTIQLNNDAAQHHHWRQNMDFQESRRWDRYWGLPGRDYAQIQLAAAVDWDPDVNEDFGGGEVGGQTAQGADRTGNVIQDDGLVEGRPQEEDVGQGDFRDEIDIDQPDGEGFAFQDDSDEVSEASTQNDRDKDRDSGYNTASPTDSPTPQAATMASPEHRPLEPPSSTGRVDPLDLNQLDKELATDVTSSGPSSSTMPRTFSDNFTSFPPFQPTANPRTISQTSPAHDNDDIGVPPVFRENGFGCLSDDGPSPDPGPNPPSRDANLRPRGAGSFVEIGVHMDNTLNDGLVRRGRDVSYPHHRWMGSVA